MNEPTDQNAKPGESIEEAIARMPVWASNEIVSEHSYASTAVPATETRIPLAQKLETATVAARAISRESHEQAQQTKVASAILKFIAFGMGLMALAILVGLVYLLKDIFVLVGISFVIAYVLSPIVDSIERKGAHRTLVVTFITLLFLGSFTLISILAFNGIAEQIIKLSEDIRKPETREQLVDTIAEWMDQTPDFILSPLLAYLEKQEETARAVKEITTIEDAEKPPQNRTAVAPTTPQSTTSGPSPGVASQEIFRREQALSLVAVAQEQILRYVLEHLSNIGSSAKGVFSAFTKGIIILFLTFFVLNGGQKMKKAFIQVVPNRYFEPTLMLIADLDQQLGDYLRSRLVETIALSILFTIGYWALGLRFAILLGVIAGLANLIPYLGPLIGVIPAIIVVFIDPYLSTGWSLLSVITLTLVVQIIDNAIITPLIIGKSVDLGPVTTIVVILIGEQLLGLLGLLMAVPVAAMLKLICQEIYTQFKGYSRSILHGN